MKTITHLKYLGILAAFALLLSGNARACEAFDRAVQLEIDNATLHQTKALAERVLTKGSANVGDKRVAEKNHWDYFYNRQLRCDNDPIGSEIAEVMGAVVEALKKDAESGKLLLYEALRKIQDIIIAQVAATATYTKSLYE